MPAGMRESALGGRVRSQQGSADVRATVTPFPPTAVHDLVAARRSSDPLGIRSRVGLRRRDRARRNRPRPPERRLGVAARLADRDRSRACGRHHGCRGYADPAVARRRRCLLRKSTHFVHDRSSQRRLAHETLASRSWSEARCPWSRRSHSEIGSKWNASIPAVVAPSTSKRRLSPT
jgi:hypothetical protein